jgi:hypothetical protein
MLDGNDSQFLKALPIAVFIILVREGYILC